MALRLSAQRLRRAPDPPPEAAGVPEPSPGDEGVGDDAGAKPGRRFPGDEPGDFYADAMETV